MNYMDVFFAHSSDTRLKLLGAAGKFLWHLEAREDVQHSILAGTNTPRLLFRQHYPLPVMLSSEQFDLGRGRHSRIQFSNPAQLKTNFPDGRLVSKPVLCTQVHFAHEKSGKNPNNSVAVSLLQADGFEKLRKKNSRNRGQREDASNGRGIEPNEAGDSNGLKLAFRADSGSL
jgi:hypothetical protein